MKTLPTAAAAVLVGSLLTATPAVFAQAPGQAGQAPSQAGQAPGQAGQAAGQAVQAPGQAPQATAAAPAPGGAPAAGAAGPGPAPVRPPKMPYGMPITLAQAKRVAAAAEAAAIQANVKVAIAITDNNGELVYFEQLDDTSTGIRELAVQKARFSARFRMPTSYVAAMKRRGNDVFAAFPGAFPGGGGVTLTYDGYTIGGLGVSGGADGPVADAGAAALAELERASGGQQREGAPAPGGESQPGATGGSGQPATPRQSSGFGAR